jgi:hypothetical protein
MEEAAYTDKVDSTILDRIFQEFERLSMNYEVLRKKLQPLIIEVPENPNERLEEISRNRLHEIELQLRGFNHRVVELTRQIEL